MAMGLKRVETRSWETRYRGPLYIHAAKKIIGWPSMDIQAVFEGIAFQPSDLPRGCLICKLELVDIKKIYNHNRPPYPEEAFGDYTPGRFMWITENVERFEPIPYRGRQRLFNVIIPDQEPDLPKQQVMEFR